MLQEAVEEGGQGGVCEMREEELHRLEWELESKLQHWVTKWTAQLHRSTYTYMYMKKPNDRETKQHFYFNLPRSALFSEKYLLSWVGPRPSAYKVAALPTELPGQLSWLGRITHTYTLRVESLSIDLMNN